VTAVTDRHSIRGHPPCRSSRADGPISFLDDGPSSRPRKGNPSETMARKMTGLRRMLRWRRYR